MFSKLSKIKFPNLSSVATILQNIALIPGSFLEHSAGASIAIPYYIPPQVIQQTNTVQSRQRLDADMLAAKGKSVDDLDSLISFLSGIEKETSRLRICLQHIDMTVLRSILVSDEAKEKVLSCFPSEAQKERFLELVEPQRKMQREEVDLSAPLYGNNNNFKFIEKFGIYVRQKEGEPTGYIHPQKKPITMDSGEIFSHFRFNS